MIYLKIINATMRTHLPTVRVFLWIILGIAVLLTNLALNRTSPLVQDSTATPHIQTGTVVNEEEQYKGAGSTDWIMLLAVMIVFIVIIPILVLRRTWENGERSKTAPPR